MTNSSLINFSLGTAYVSEARIVKFGQDKCWTAAINNAVNVPSM